MIKLGLTSKFQLTSFDVSPCLYCKDEELSDRKFPIVDEKGKMGIEHRKGQKKIPALREPAFLFNYYSRLTIQDLNSDALFFTNIYTLRHFYIKVTSKRLSNQIVMSFTLSREMMNCLFARINQQDLKKKLSVPMFCIWIRITTL